MPVRGRPAPRAATARLLALVVAQLAVGGCNVLLGFEPGQSGSGLGGSAGATSPSGGGAGGAGGLGPGGAGGAGNSTGGAGAVGGGGASGGPPTLHLSVDADDRDGWDDGETAGIDWCSFGDAQWFNTAGLQWSLPVPPGATILAAHVSVYALAHSGESDSYTVAVLVEDTDDPAPFDATPGNIRNRVYHGVGVDWDIPTGGLTPDQWTDSPPLEHLIQLAVDRGGWQSGDFVSLSIRGVTSAFGASERIADVHDSLGRSAQLHVEYEFGGR